MPLTAFTLTAIVAWLVVFGLVAVKGTSLGCAPLRSRGAAVAA